MLEGEREGCGGNGSSGASLSFFIWVALLLLANDCVSLFSLLYVELSSLT